MRSDQVRSEIHRLARASPFRKFVIRFEHGQQILSEHPEHIAYHPGPQASEDFYVLTSKLHLHRPFEAVTSVMLADRDGDAASRVAATE